MLAQGWRGRERCNYQLHHGIRGANGLSSHGKHTPAGRYSHERTHTHTHTNTGNKKVLHSFMLDLFSVL